MTESLKKFIKAAIIPIIVAFLFAFIVLLVFYKVGNDKLILATDLIDVVTIKTDSKDLVEPVLENHKLENYPTVGSKYGTLKIDSIEVSLPIYYGTSYNVLKGGVGHDTNSFFPGEGGSIVYMGHNFKKFLARLPETKIDDIIEIETTYGTFEYKIYDQQVINELETDKVPIQTDEEILMIYTCWPINNIGHAYQRYIVYAKPAY